MSTPPPDAAAYVDPAAWYVLGASVVLTLLVIAGALIDHLRQARRAGRREAAEHLAMQEAQAETVAPTGPGQSVLVKEGEIELLIPCGCRGCVAAARIFAQRLDHALTQRRAQIEAETERFRADVDRASERGW